MSVYKRVSCPKCKKNIELRNGNDKLKKITCRCGNYFAVTSDNSVYYIEYCFNNKRYRERVGDVSKSFAETVLYKRKVEIAEGKFLDVDKKEDVKFEDFAEEYLTVHSKQHKKSWETDFHILKNLKKHFGGKYLYEITPKDIEHFKMERLKDMKNNKPISPATINRQLDVLSGMFNKAIAWARLKTSPMKSVQSLKVPKGRLRFLEQEEIFKLLSNCTGNLKAIVTLALFTGMRQGEIFGLKWYDIDFKRNIITLLDTKNGDKREVSMSEMVKNALIEVKKHPDCAYIFCDEQGNPVHDIRKSYSTALEKSGITNFTFHDLRHTFASQLVMSGIDLNTVRELLGHKDLTMTLRYSHLSPNHKQRAVELLAKRFATGLPQSTNLELAEKSDASQVVDNSIVSTFL